jgi:homoserine dehydrogenase
LYYGAGAGSEPTASAVVADVVDVVRMLTTDPENRVPHLAFQPGELVDLAILPIDEVETTFYLRMQVVDKPGVVARIASILAESQISIEAIQQKEPNEGDNTVPLVMLTQKVIEKQLDKAIAEIEQLDTVFGRVMRIRVERLDG